MGIPNQGEQGRSLVTFYFVSYHVNHVLSKRRTQLPTANRKRKRAARDYWLMEVISSPGLFEPGFWSKRHLPCRRVWSPTEKGVGMSELVLRRITNVLFGSRNSNHESQEPHYCCASFFFFFFFVLQFSNSQHYLQSHTSLHTQEPTTAFSENPRSQTLLHQAETMLKRTGQ